MNSNGQKVAVLLMICALAGCGNQGDNVFGVIELVNKVAADEEAWKGKDVTVSGWVANTSGSNGENGYQVHLRPDRTTPIERHISCKVSQGVLPEGILSTTIKVKGKIARLHRQNYLDLKSVVLDSCEIVN